MSAEPLAVMLRPLGLGDFLTAVPAYRAVCRAFPRHRKVLAAPSALEPLAGLVDGIDEVVDAAPLCPLPARLHGADVALNLHGRGPQSHRILIDAGARRLIGFAHPYIPQSSGGAEWRADEHEVRRWCRMLAHAGIPARADDLRLRVPLVAVPRRFHGATIVHPGAASAARRWPLERWTDVVRALEAEGHRVVVTGTQREVPLAAELVARAGLPRRRCVAGRTTLCELAGIVARARLLLSSDTGVAHLATAYDRPSVVLFGPTPPRQWGPLDPSRHVVLWSGRTGDPHAAKPDPGLLEIGVAEVLSAVERFGGGSTDATGRTAMSRWAERVLGREDAGTSSACKTEELVKSASPSSRPTGSNASS